MARAMILTGGVGHAFAETAPALAAILAGIGMETEIETDLDRGVAAWDRDTSFDLLVIHALRWRMLAERYATLREAWGFDTSPALRQAIARGVASGRALVGLHTAAICFDDWPEWGEILGGAWDWERSFHPPYGSALVQPHAGAHPIVQGLPAFAIEDEIYSDLVLQPGVAPLASARVGEGQAWPVLWTHGFGRGRIVCDLLGHDHAALDHPVHRRILLRAAAWASGRPDAEVSAL